MSASRGLVFTASGPAWRWTAACFASSVMQRARGQPDAMLQRLHPTLRSRASTCSYSVKGAEANPALPGTSQRPSPQQGRRRPSDLVDPTPFLLLLSSTLQTLPSTSPAAILAIVPARRLSDSIATKQNPRLHSADRFLGTEANHPPSARPSLPSRADERPPRKPLKVTFEKHLSTSTLL